MKKALIYLIVLLPLFAGCRQDAKKTSWEVTLDHEGKAPYDTWLAYETLQWYFPQARREVISRNFRYTSIDNSMMQPGEDSAALLIMTGLDYYVSDEEWEKIKLFAQAGNEVFIICSKLDNKIETALKCSKEGGEETVPLNKYNDGTSNNHVLAVLPDTIPRYGYTGRSIESAFSIPDNDKKDTASSHNSNGSMLEEASEPATEQTEDTFGKPEVLGFYGKGRPNFLRYSVGSGHITLHAAPLAFSNYFLLQDGNRKYLDGIWHNFPDNISHVYWNEYYRRSTEGSSMNVLLRYPATRWALIIAVTTLLIYVLLGLKRRQRVIPIVRPLENASVSFVETIGQLYFNKGNHANLAEKMIQHFLEWVRTYYFLDTSMLNDAFTQQLVAKSGKSEKTIQDLVAQIHDIRLGSVHVTAEYLFDLYNTLQSFYNNQRS